MRGINSSGIRSKKDTKIEKMRRDAGNHESSEDDRLDAEGREGEQEGDVFPGEKEKSENTRDLQRLDDENLGTEEDGVEKSKKWLDRRILPRTS